MQKDRTVVEFDARRLVATCVALLGILQFGICVLAVGSATPGFEFAGDFLSELGRTTNPGGQAFNRSIVLLGICLIGFSVYGYLVGSPGDSAATVFGWSGVVSALGLIGIGTTPLDTMYLAHIGCLVLWLIPMIVMVVSGLAMLGMYGQNGCVIIIPAVLLIGGIMRYVGVAGSDSAPAAQAFVAVTGIAWLLLTSVLAARMSIWQIRTARLGNEVATRRYIQHLESTGMFSEAGKSSSRWQPQIESSAESPADPLASQPTSIDGETHGPGP